MKSIIIQRNAAFAEVCRRLIAGHRKNKTPIPFADLLDKALNTRPERHFVDYDNAVRSLYAFRRGRGSYRKELTARKWAEINEQVNMVMARRPRVTFPMAVAFTLAYKRPARFYISEKQARAILREVISAETMVI